LARYYSLADVSLLTSQKETFSMVTAESLCCGTPVVGFKAGAPEQIALEEFSRFVNHGDIDSLQKEIMSFLNMQFDNKDIAIKSQCYSKATMTNNYQTVYNSLYKRFSQ
jgi:glycosyltransferase involved in cell wall biosynthesis